MFLEGEIDWVLLLGVIAAVSTVTALVAIVFAVTRGVRHASATDELNLVQQVAEASDKRLFEILNAIPVALVETDRQGKFVFANRAAHQLLGRRDAELLGLRFHSATWGITFPDGRPVPPDMLPSARALRGQTVKGFQHLLANAATRRKMLVSVTAMPIENAAGEVIGSTAAIVETEGLITPEAAPSPFEPTAAEPAAGADLTRRVFDTAPSALVVVGADGCVREANATALALLGRTEGVIGEPFAELYLDDGEREEGRRVLGAAFGFGADPDAGIVSARGAGVRWSLLPLRAGDGPTDAVLLAGEGADAAEPAGADPAPGGDEAEVALRALADAAAAREAELAAERDQARLDAEAARAETERVEAQARADQAGINRMESVGRLTGGVAHDFGSLLGVMTSALDMMLRQADDPGRVRRLGEAALAAGRRGEEMTRRLTAFAQGEDAPSLQSLDAGVLLKALDGRLRALAGPGVDLMIEGPLEPAPARIDPVAFEGAVKALVLNAVQAVGGQGSVAVRLETLMEGGLRLSVRDTGPGMDRELATRAIEPFFTTKDGAAGLGLSQAYAFARQSAGTLSIDSGPGEGAEVAITLPSAA